MTTRDFFADVVDGLLVTVTPNGWAVRARGRLLASGHETGRLGFDCAMRALGVGK